MSIRGANQVTYRIKEVDATDEDVAETLDHLHELCFADTAPKIDHDYGCRWWMAFHEKEAVAFGGVVPSRSYSGTGYLYRAGVLDSHRGNALQRRLLRAREAAARKV